ncbi:50S ribosomal protein L22 [Candidatus Kaiserbacteria bacterium CG10_big_fil_rev_8_21_14_0_10_59_10]|uniref:Large ribosomal subunit protein uL22 n=1 Tax=Candidatus Kaiserbacteria bacterium CG10_big_fil_rev_8_21_14_0_10_59_10 TaxID=1974612 RepID=A0A2H0U8T0_9BACT|nr:MAG: 50S ribosomal protein L22 [Candidatus Kaiserbacteria bacterium CG10_big_fil_rev_8_21_14_0_10_59_10]
MATNTKDTVRAKLSGHRQSPRKTRLVADAIRGKSVSDARVALSFLPKKSAPAVLKLLESAVANARSAGLTEDSLVVKRISVDKSGVMRRYTPMARGRAARYAKTMSTISLELASAAGEKPAAKRKTKTASSRPSKLEARN